MKKLMLACVAAVCSAGVQADCIDTWVDCHSSAESPDGTPEAPFKTIQEGLDATPAGAVDAWNTVHVRKGTYLLSSTIKMSKNYIRLVADDTDFLLKDNPNHDNQTIIDGNGAVLCLSVTAVADISGFTVKNGYVLATSTSYGAGVSFAASSGGVVSNCHVTSCLITTSTAGNLSIGGAAVSDRSSKYAFYDVLISNNVLSNGVEAVASTMDVGAAALGGKLWKGCVFRDNLGYRPKAMNTINAVTGGALYSTESLILDSCLFISNRIAAALWDRLTTPAGCGGALYAPEAVATNCLFEGNQASAYGGAAYIGHAVGCTFRGNEAGDGGGAIYLGNKAKKCLVANCIFEGNIGRGANENQDHVGGAILVNVGDYEVRDCIFRSNETYTVGSAIGVGNASGHKITRCLFEGNACRGTKGFNRGGVIAATTSAFGGVGNFVLTDSIFRGNRAVANVNNVLISTYFLTGATAQSATFTNMLIRNVFAVDNEMQTFYWGGDKCPATCATYQNLIENCTIVGNTLLGKSGNNYFKGIDAAYAVQSNNGSDFRVPEVRNCLFAYNTHANGSESNVSPVETTTSSLFNCFVRTQNAGQGTLDTSADGAKNIYGDDPGFVSREDGDYRLTKSSVCVDKAVYSSWMATAKDMGTGEFIEKKFLDYGVTLTPNTARVRVFPKGGVLPDIGCFEYYMAPGLMLLLK